MDRCIWCGLETDLYLNGQPMCPRCCDALEEQRDGSQITSEGSVQKRRRGLEGEGVIRDASVSPSGSESSGSESLS